jgi:predicted permease
VITDLKFALRVLARSPLLTLVVILSLGLGIGANTAIFSMLHQVILQTLPVAKPEELVNLTFPGDFKGGRNSTSNAGGMDYIFSYKMFRNLESNKQGMQGLAAFRETSANFSYKNQTVDGTLLIVSGGYFDLLGVQPMVGRTLTPGDDRHGAGNAVAILSHAYWQNRLGAPRDVLNQPLRVNGKLFTIAGVAPHGFTGTVFGQQPDVFVPLAMKKEVTPGWDGTDRWDDYWLYVFGRRQPGFTLEQAQAAMNGPYHAIVAQQLAENPKSLEPEDLPKYRESHMTLKEGSRGATDPRNEGRTPILILLAATGLVLLIAIANIANLLLARSAQRRKELAIRTALGASAASILRQVLTEAILLSFGGGVAGLLVAMWTINFLAFEMTGGEIPESLSVHLDWPVLLFACGVSLFTGLLCGLYPGWEAARSSMASTLKDEAGSVSASAASARVRRLLVCGQMAISILLLIPTGLFLRSLVNLVRVDLGIKSENVITFGISPELNGYKPDQSRALFERAEAELAAIPGVQTVTAAMVPLISGSNWGNSLFVEGYPRDSKVNNSMFNLVGPGHFGKLGIPLVVGREFNERDNLASGKVAIVNEQFVKQFFPNTHPIGHHFSNMGSKALDIEVIGVIKDAHYSGVKQSPPRVYYLPYRQSSEIGSLQFYVRSALPSDKVMPQIRRVIKSLDADLPLENLRTLDEQISRNIRSDRLVLQLSAAFAVLATLLAMLGLYGVMAYNVARRTREIGIRIALGAAQENIRGMVMREVGFIIAAGVVIGVPAALALARLTESQLFGVKSFDPIVVAGAVVALSLSAVFAGYLPARRATRVDPIVALRYE